MTDELSHNDKVAIERVNFRGHLRNTAGQPDFVRLCMVPVHLKYNLSIGAYTGTPSNPRLLPLEEMFQEMFGSEGSRKFWEGECSIIRPMSSVLELFWLTCEGADTREDSVYLGLKAAIFTAYQMGEAWIIADPTVFAGVQFGSEIRVDHVKIDVRRAALWLLDKPPFAHLVPASLKTFLVPRVASPRSRPNQEEVNTWMINLYQRAYNAGHPRPKRELEAFPACEHDIHATQTQMKSAMKKVPSEHKRGKGIRDR